MALSIRPRASLIRANSSATSGTMRLPASVGVEARTSATASTMGESASCPIADTTGVWAAATARTSDSSENGSRSSNEPPPRASTITSTSGSASSSESAAHTSRTAFAPCTATCRTSKTTPGHRSEALRITSFMASESRPVTSPTFCGSSGSGFLRESANSPSAASASRSCCSRSCRLPVPTAWIRSPTSDRRPLGTQKLGFASTTTRAPGTTSLPML